VDVVFVMMIVVVCKFMIKVMSYIFCVVTIDNMFCSMLCFVCFMDSLWVNMMVIVMHIVKRVVIIVMVIMVYIMGAIDEWIIIYKMLHVTVVCWIAMVFKSVMMLVMEWSEVSVIMMSTNNTVTIVLWVNSPFAVVSSDSVVLWSISLIVWPEDFVLYFISWMDHASSSLISCLSSVCLSNHVSEWFLLVLHVVSLFSKFMFIVMIRMMSFMWSNYKRS
jgi:hypothetical protein